MKRTIVLMIGSVLMTGCVNGKFVSGSVPNQCGGQGWTHTIVHYGDSRVVVIPVSEVRAGQEMRFFLVPQLKGRGATDFQNATVKIVGKPPADVWFTQKTGNASAVFLSFCVNGSLAVNDTFEYKVEVFDSTGTDLKAMLDPRAIVID